MRLTRLKLARLESGLRQWDVARRVGVSESQLSKIETGRIIPDASVIERIAAVLDVLPEELRPAAPTESLSGYPKDQTEIA